MGLLDDAIREHLELKRRHGASPDDVAREEREVLGARPEPAPAAEPEAEPAEAPFDAADEPVEEPADEAPFDAAEAEEPPRAAGEAPAPADETRVMEEPADEADPWLEGARDEVPADDALDHRADPGEDVLEETPEFLQETPEHERLWFEQRPPRDFDWDK